MRVILACPTESRSCPLPLLYNEQGREISTLTTSQTLPPIPSVFLNSFTRSRKKFYDVEVILPFQKMRRKYGKKSSSFHVEKICEMGKRPPSRFNSPSHPGRSTHHTLEVYPPRPPPPPSAYWARECTWLLTMHSRLR